MRIAKIVKSVIKVKFAEMRKHNICSAISGTEVRVTPEYRIIEENTILS